MLKHSHAIFVTATFALAGTLGGTARAATCDDLPAFYDPSRVVGGQLFAADTGTVTVTYCNATGSFQKNVYFEAAEGDILIGAYVSASSTPFGTEVGVGEVIEGQELIFSLTELSLGHTYYTGPGSRNHDGYAHAATFDLGDGRYAIAMEDYPSTEDYPGTPVVNDVMLVVSSTGSLSGETDLDGDGSINLVDNCFKTYNPDQADYDMDDIGDACDPCPMDSDGDIDGDGLCGDVDNCFYDTNANQSDLDGDGFGDACDADVDGDGVIEGEDACAQTPAGKPVNADGCAIAQLCPCDAPEAWKNHGAYTRCVAAAAQDFLEAGLIDKATKATVISDAAKSACGK